MIEMKVNPRSLAEWFRFGSVLNQNSRLKIKRLTWKLYVPAGIFIPYSSTLRAL